MSSLKSSPAFSDKIYSSEGKVHIIASLFNENYVEKLLKNTIEELEKAKGVNISISRVPGSFEIPAMASRVLKSNPKTAIIALGIIFEGKTHHANMIAESATHALQTLAIKYTASVIHQILFVKNEEQAKERCFGELNRGAEAGRAALQMLSLLSS